MRPVPAIVESAYTQVFAEVRASWSALREAEVQAEKSEERAVKARRIADRDRDAIRELRLATGKKLLAARAAWPERGPRAKGWGEFLEREGISQPTAWRLMEEAGGETQISFSDDRLNEIPPPADRDAPAGEQPDPPRVRLGKVQDMQLLLGTWQDMLGDIGQVDVLLSDPPYSPRVHKSKPTRDDDSDPDGATPNYDPWEPSDVHAFVEHWSPRVRGWMGLLCDDELIPAYRAAYERMGRVAFAPVPCIISGMTVRLRGDGPSSEAVYLMVGRPATGEFARWGTTPGKHIGNREHGAKHGRGKPLWLTDELVRYYSRGNDLVCDPLAGYGGTLVSALRQNRRAIGAEMDPKAVEEAFRRVNAGEGLVNSGEEPRNQEQAT